MKAYKYVVLIDFTQASLFSSSLRTLADQLHKILSNSIYVMNEDTITFLCSHDGITSPIEEELDVMKGILLPLSVYAGVSSVFSSLDRLRDYITEAQSSITTGLYLNNQKRVFLYDELRFNDMARYCFQNTDWTHYCYPPYMRLLEYDKTHNTKLVDTLVLYLTKEKRISEICSDLFIHKNTLYYRLDKIRDIMKDDFEQPSVIAQIEITRALLECQSKSPIKE